MRALAGRMGGWGGVRVGLGVRASVLCVFICVCVCVCVFSWLDGYIPQ